MKIELLEDLYKQQLVELYDAERQNRRSLNKMARMTSNTELQSIFRAHARETGKQIGRLETILSRLGAGEEKKKSKAMAGLLADAKELLKKPAQDRDLLDTAFSLSAQKAEAFEIFSYGTVSHFAKLLNFHEDVGLLQQTLDEERRMAERLASLSENLTFEAMETEVRQAV